MKRHLFKLPLFLILGAIVNVAVAWGCALAISHQGQSGSKGKVEVWRGVLQEIDEIKCTVFPNRRPGSQMFVAQWSSIKNSTKLAPSDLSKEEIPPRWIRAILVEHTLDSQIGPTIVINASGWPILSFYSISDFYTSQVTHGLPLSDSSNSSRRSTKRSVALPIDPIWPGFAINMIFYATLLWLLTLAPFTARRMIRNKRGQCIKCGYDLRGEFEQGCPECGWQEDDAKELETTTQSTQHFNPTSRSIHM